MSSLKRKSNSDGKEAKRRNVERENLKLLSSVFDQGILGSLVILQTENESPYVVLQNALSYVNIPLSVGRNPTNLEEFVLKIDGEDYAQGVFANIQLARVPLAEEALDKLRKICFFIVKKKNYVDVTNNDLAASSSATRSMPILDEESVAHKMMLKMGWSGKGLGVQEQGNVNTVTVYENISRQGFGNKNVMKEITQVLDNFSKSTKLTTLAFDSEFTKEERSLIHKAARKFNLKSKSEGQGTDRRITVSRKLSRADIVKELLKIGGENDCYKLHIPTDFVHLLE